MLTRHANRPRGNNVWCPTCRRTVPIANFSDIETSGVVPADAGGALPDDDDTASSPPPSAAATATAPETGSASSLSSREARGSEAGPVARTPSGSGSGHRSTAAASPASPRWATRSGPPSAAASAAASTHVRQREDGCIEVT